MIKALALGAKAVGIGRPALYGMASYGQAGVERVLQILADESAPPYPPRPHRCDAERLTLPPQWR